MSNLTDDHRTIFPFQPAGDADSTWGRHVRVWLHADGTHEGVALEMSTNPLPVATSHLLPLDAMVEFEVALADGSGRSLRVLGEVVQHSSHTTEEGRAIPVLYVELWGVDEEDVRGALERLIEEHLERPLRETRSTPVGCDV